ncbi:MAG: hypothetical protein WCG91_02880 [Candidatus Shapirobacteria bacterium]
MKNKILIVLLVIFNILAVLYLISPTPKIPDLINSVKSDKSEDTTEIPNVSGYFTNMSRAQVMDFYKKNYNGLFKTISNYPPEKAKTLFRVNMETYYLEEISFPFKESLYINGFEWENDVFTKPEKRAAINYKGTDYKSRITIRTFPTSIPNRLISFFFTESVIIFAFYAYKSFLKKKK